MVAANVIRLVTQVWLLNPLLVALPLNAKGVCSLFTRHVSVEATPCDPPFEISRVSRSRFKLKSLVKWHHLAEPSSNTHCILCFESIVWWLNYAFGTSYALRDWQCVLYISIARITIDQVKTTYNIMWSVWGRIYAMLIAIKWIMDNECINTCLHFHLHTICQDIVCMWSNQGHLPCIYYCVHTHTHGAWCVLWYQCVLK